MVYLKTDKEIKLLREANKIVGEILKRIVEKLKPGMNTLELDEIAEEEIKKRNVIPSFKGYDGYKFASCISVNEEVVHGIPGRRIINEGDIVSIDLGVIYKGFNGDAALTYPVGEISNSAFRLIKTTYESLHEGIKMAKVGNKLGDISSSIQRKIESENFHVVKAFVGHGIGRELHEDPQVPNFGRKGTGMKLREGMTISIEPMVGEETGEVEILGDGWTAVTKDSSLSAHFEHTIAITKNGPEILSREWEDAILGLFN